MHSKWIFPQWSNYLPLCITELCWYRRRLPARKLVPDLPSCLTPRRRWPACLCPCADQAKSHEEAQDKGEEHRCDLWCKKRIPNPLLLMMYLSTSAAPPHFTQWLHPGRVHAPYARSINGALDIPVHERGGTNMGDQGDSYGCYQHGASLLNCHQQPVFFSQWCFACEFHYVVSNQFPKRSFLSTTLTGRRLQVRQGHTIWDACMTTS